MKEIVIKENEAGQRFDKYLKKYMPEAPGSFLYKMLRKKNIVLNGKKASGSEKLAAGDTVKLFLAEETVEKFSGKKEGSQYISSDILPVIYEDNNLLIFNKPAGMLSQKAVREDVSVAEYAVGYLLESGQLKKEDLGTFKPGVCNRLDRNTSGLIVAGKSLVGLQEMAELFKNRTLEKYYLCIVKGCIKKPSHIKGFLKKDERTNRVTITEKPEARQKEEYKPIETAYVPVAYQQEMTLLKVHLITGKTHQIRAHLAGISHPLLGDYKYGDRMWNDRYKKQYHISSQMLHAYELHMPQTEGKLSYLADRTFQAPVPPVFYKIIEDTAWEHGIQEALEVQH